MCSIRVPCRFCYGTGRCNDVTLVDDIQSDCEHLKELFNICPVCCGKGYIEYDDNIPLEEVDENDTCREFRSSTY